MKKSKVKQVRFYPTLGICALYIRYFLKLAFLQEAIITNVCCVCERYIMMTDLILLVSI